MRHCPCPGRTSVAILKSPPLSSHDEFRIISMFALRSLSLTLLMGTCLTPVGFAQDADTSSPEPSFSPEQIEFYTTQIQPLLEKNCYKCHGGSKVKGGLNLSGRWRLLTGGDSGPAVDLESPAASLLLDAINYENYEMPPSGKLPPEQIALITKWVELGAPMPVLDKAAAPPAEEHHGPPQVNDETRAHWAFQPVHSPSMPDVSHEDWVANPIDAFVLARLDAAGLAPAPAADSHALCRRLYYDLTGLPPTPEEVDAFVNDTSPDAYERLVETLLDSPHYGEHWARYWLDLVRYAETNSFERDNPKPYVWRYRDYVIRAFNDDKPYDQFIREQLAGDELDEVTTDGIIATGFYRLGLWDDEPADPLLAYYDGLDDIAATTAQAFLGLTMNCARCHDHKLDPIPQADYYSFLAFFRNIRHYGARADDTVLAASVRDIDLPAEQGEQQERLERHRDQVEKLTRYLRRIEEKALPELVGGERDDFQDISARHDILSRGVGRLISEKELNQYNHLRDELDKLERNPPPALAQALAVKENGPDAPLSHVLIRGNPQAEGNEVQPAFPSVLSPPEPHIVVPAHGESTGRRRALAEWITNPHNPLTARVMANRLWQWHFGRGLVRSANNFGLQGDLPTHPELLDWLAAEFIARGWSLKAMHRLIVMSNTYRMASSEERGAGSEESAISQPTSATDPTNDLLWRFDMRRLRAEEIRDSILAVNGTLNREKMFGPSIYPVIPAAVLAGQSRPGEGWEDSSEEDRRRRSIYIHLKRSLVVPILAAFDVADTDFTCPVRFATTQPTQALGMLNSEFINEQAEVFADYLRTQVGHDPREQVTLALRQTLQRDPTEVEVDRGLALMTSLRQDHGLSVPQSLHYFCLTALNLNEFVYLD